MTPDEFFQKQRLRYLRECYFPELTIAYLSRRIRDDCLPHEKDRILRNAILKIGTTYHSGDRAVRTFFEADGPAPPARAVRSACEVFAAEFLSDHGRHDDCSAIANALQRYVKSGEGGPFRIFNDDRLPFNELAFEYLPPLIMEPQEVADFGALQRLRPHEAARTFLRGGPPRDWPVLRHVAIARPIESELVGALQEGAQLVVLTGAAGDGKTTLLKRAGMILRQNNWRVFLAEALSQEPFRELSR